MNHRRRDAAVVFLVALLARAVVVLWARHRFPAAEDGAYYDRLAHRLASGSGYTWLWPDGSVTYAAHYPVGYPGLLAAAYALFGPSLGVAMGLNAVLGAAGAFAIHRLVDDPDGHRWRPFAAGLVVALHPALVAYTAAPMTEGVTAALLAVAGAAARPARSARRAWPWLAASGLAMGLATLVRPQSLLVAPAIGWMAAPRAARFGPRLASALAVVAIALGCVSPWTLRNCFRMHRCALVSVNGGWNLLIGASTSSGGWQPVAVPHECATVWDEGAKDSCFGRAAARSIAASPRSWLASAPAKVAMTLDYIGAGPWYLHASNATAFGESDKIALATVETATCRALLLGALVACGRLRGRRPRLRRWLALAGAVFAVSPHAWPAYVGVAACVALAGRRTLASAPMIVPMAACVILTTVAVHAVFFGAGRYGLAVVMFVSGLAFVKTGSADKPDGPLATEPGKGHLGRVGADEAIAG
jgi:4-amino-4-deoxy-L-arabinose transferase-like glycosyltransferase